MHDHPYLNTEQAAAYLNIKERKLYDLVATGVVPCSKVTGKWLFPRAALDRWISAGLAHPQGFIADPAPPIIGGSHDLLLEWAARRSGSGLALLSEGSAAGLGRLARNEVAIAAVHFHESDGECANERAVMAARGLHDSVVIAFARREQGLVLAPGNPCDIPDLETAIADRRRFGLRQQGAGAQLLFEMLLAGIGVTAEAVVTAPAPYPTGQDLALGIRAGDIDCGIATRSVAQTHGLGFLPLVWEKFDLVLRRRSYFEPGPQALVALMRRPEFSRQASAFGGYDTAEAGLVRQNL